MKRWPYVVALFAAALWWGSLTALGVWVVPTLFAKLENARQAGQMAAQLFSIQAMTSTVCALVLLVIWRKAQSGPSVAQGQSIRPVAGDATVWLVSGMFLALLVEFAIAPRIALRENLKLWHGLGTLLLVLQWVCAAASLVHAGRLAARDPSDVSTS